MSHTHWVEEKGITYECELRQHHLVPNVIAEICTPRSMRDKGGKEKEFVIPQSRIRNYARGQEVILIKDIR